MVSKWYPTMLGISLRELPEREECVLKFLCWNLYEFVTRNVIYILLIYIHMVSVKKNPIEIYDQRSLIHVA